MVLGPRADAQPASANSLWRTGARAFFNDQRAGKVGDILTVQIDIDDSAKTTNSTASSRTAGLTAGVPHLLGLESSLGKILPGGFDPANAAGDQLQHQPTPAPARSTGRRRSA